MLPQPILLVDDSPDDILTINHALKRARILNPVQTVSNAEDAMCYVKGEGLYSDRQAFPFPALLLLDLKMPGRSGFEVLTWLKQNPRFRPAGVVILAGLNDLKDIRRAYELGANSFLTKPLQVEDLLNVVQGLPGLGVSSLPEGIRLDLA